MTLVGQPSVCLSVSLSVSLSVTLVYCGQMAECIKMALGTEVGHGPGDIVLDGDSAPLPEKGTAATAEHLFSDTKQL